MPIADASFDTIVSTYTLCTYRNPVTALREMRRVLVPGGKLLFSEHGRAPDENVSKWQTRLQPFWTNLPAGACWTVTFQRCSSRRGSCPMCSRDTFPALRPPSYHYWGEAVAA